jgi:DNA topoisomerase-3
LDVELQQANSGKSINVKWSRVHLFDRDVVYMFFNEVKKCDKALVSSVIVKDKVKERPQALNTVELLRACSAGLGISPIHAMHAAEKLYTQGYISYPRTETTHYAENFDFKEVLRGQTQSPVWGGFVSGLLSGKMVNPKKGSVSKNIK